MTPLTTVPIGEVADINPTFKSDFFSPDELVDFLPMATVKEGNSVALATEHRPLSDVQKGYTNFNDGDVLLAKITPCFENGKIAQVRLRHRFGFGSTEFHVLRPHADKLDGRYLVHFLRRDEIRIDGARKMTGSAGQRRVPKHYLESLPVYLPPLPEQRHIAAILDQADALRAKRREALAQLDHLTQSIFIEMFGEYRSGHSPWPVELFEQIAAETKIGLVRGSEEFGSDFAVPYVRMNAVGRSGEFFPELVLRTNVSQKEIEEFSLEPGDLLFNTRNSKELVGKTALFREQGVYVYNNNLMRIRFRDGIDPEYVSAAFLTPYIQHELEIRKAGTTSVFAIYARELKSLPIPIPPLALQEVFAARITAIEDLKRQHCLALHSLNALFASLQHRAFRGEL